MRRQETEEAGCCKLRFGKACSWWLCPSSRMTRSGRERTAVYSSTAQAALFALVQSAIKMGGLNYPRGMFALFLVPSVGRRISDKRLQAFGGYSSAEERLRSMQEVTGSNPVISTNNVHWLESAVKARFASAMLI
jgi:hypothetical protein